MAKTKEISVGFRRTISDGDYGSYGFDVHEVVSLEDGDVSKEVYLETKERVRKRAFVFAKELIEAIEKGKKRK